MALDALNQAVTQAIFEAEAADHAAALAWDKVATCEQAIVDASPPGSLDHVVARAGVSQARVKARERR